MDGLKAATQQMNWRKYAHRVIVLVPSSPRIRTRCSRPKSSSAPSTHNGGTVHVLDLADIMHRNYEIEFNTQDVRQAAGSDLADAAVPEGA